MLKLSFKITKSSVFLRLMGHIRQHPWLHNNIHEFICSIILDALYSLFTEALE